MRPNPLPLLQGTLDLLVLRCLSGGRAARLRDRLDRTRADRRRSIRRRRRTLSVPASAAPSAPGRCRVGTIGEQPARPLLHADPGGARAPARGNRELAPLRARGGCGATGGLDDVTGPGRERDRKPFWYLRRRNLRPKSTRSWLHLEMRVEELDRGRDAARRGAAGSDAAVRRSRGDAALLPRAG